MFKLQVLLSIIRALIGAVPHGVQAITSSGNFVVPTGVTSIEVELCGGRLGIVGVRRGLHGRRRVRRGLRQEAHHGPDAGCDRSRSPSWRRRRGRRLPNTSAPGSGGNSQFGSGGTIYCSATGGTFNPLGNVSAPGLGNQGGIGSGGDINLYGGDGGNGQGNQGGLVFNNGGMGGSGPLSGGMQGSGTTGVPGRFPGGGASGAGTGAYLHHAAYVAAAGAAWPALHGERW